MKFKSSIIISIVCFIVILGVSCNNEAGVLKCNLKTKVVIPTDIKYEYSVVKNNGAQPSEIVDWTEFDVGSGFSVDILTAGSYTISVRGTSGTAPQLYAGSKTCFLIPGNQNNITITLYPQTDSQTADSKLSITLLTADTSDLTACSYYKKCSDGNSAVQTKVDMSVCDTGFSSASISVSPGYYEVSSYLYRNGVEVGGNIDIVLVTNNSTVNYETAINPRTFTGFVDISKTPTLSVSQDQVVTLGWVGDGGDDSNGFWFVTDKIVEDNAMYYTIPTSKTGTYTVHFYRGDLHLSCVVTVGTPKEKVDVYILNFRCQTYTGKLPCIGYEDKTTHVAFTINRTKVDAGDNFNAQDFTTINLQPVYGTLVNATFAEVKEESWLDSKYGKDLSEPNTTIKKMIIHGDLSADKLPGRFTALEELVLDGTSYIALGALSSLTNLKTVYIIPSSDGVVISKKTFENSGVTSVVVFGPESAVTFISKWNSGSSLTKSNFTFDAKLPL